MGSRYLHRCRSTLVRLPAHPHALAGSLRLVSAHAVAVTGVVLAAVIACGVVWAALAGRAGASQLTKTGLDRQKNRA